MAVPRSTSKSKSPSKKPRTAPAKESRAGSKPAPTPAEPEQDLPAVEGSEAEFERLLAEARKTPSLDIIEFRADASLAYHNIVAGLESIRPHLPALRKSLPEIDFNKVLRLGNDALGVVFAAGRTEPDAAAGISTAALLGKAHDKRTLLLTAADSLAVAGILPKKPVDDIKRGRGPVDAAQDCVNLASLFTKYAAKTRGKTVVTPADVKEAASLGTELLKRLKGKNVRRSNAATGAARDALDERNLVWSLLLSRFRDLRRAGMYLWVDEVNDYVPPLQSRAVKPRAKKNKTTTDGQVPPPK